jgi:hypothetical protein
MQTRRLNRAERNPEQIARAEAKGIRSLTGRFPLRLHVVGDCRTNFTAKVVRRMSIAPSLEIQSGPIRTLGGMLTGPSGAESRS